MALVTKPPALDESINTTELSPRNVADVLAQELSGIATAISGGSDKAPKTDIATVEPTNVASRAYSVGKLVYVNGNLYKVITAISGGATFTVGTNIQSTNVSDGLSVGVRAKNLGRYTLTANNVLDLTVDLSDVDGGLVTLDILVQAPTIGAQYITLRRTNSNTFRVISTVNQDVTFTALIITR